MGMGDPRRRDWRGETWDMDNQHIVNRVEGVGRNDEVCIGRQYIQEI